MAVRDLFDEEHLRIRLLLGLMLASFGLLLATLWHMQVAHGSQFQRDLMRQSIRRVRLPGLRGQIFDRNGVCVADNRPSYSIAVYLEELRQPGRWSRTIARVDGLLDELSSILEIPRETTKEDIQVHIKKRLPLPLLAWHDVDEKAMARLVEHASLLPGVDIYVEPVREYPLGGTACHVLGYVGRLDAPKDDEEPYHYYVPEMQGKAGIEKHFDSYLRGEPGGRLVRVDVSGFRHDDLGVRESKKGRDLRLALDSRIQRILEDALSGQRGAGIIVDPSNGDVLAMASTPGFNPNEFVPSITARKWAEITEDEHKPLLNRAVAGAYAPGSTFKPVVAMAALESGKATDQTSFTCPGSFHLGRARFLCWYTQGHGLLDLRGGLQYSCNVYFFNLGLKCGYDAIYHMAEALGYGQKTDIDLDYEVPGLLPDSAWKERIYHDRWRDGDTCNLSIGQGALAVTPMQMVMMAATMANGGTLYRPRLVTGIREAGEKEFRPTPVRVGNELHWAPENIRAVREGMRDVVMAARGTGRLAGVPGVEMAGKTGTAEIGRKGEGHKLGWMIAFAPFDHPKYAMVLMIEEAVSGGSTAAPRVKQVMTGLFEKPAAPAEGEG